MIPLSDDNPTERPPIVTVSAIVACVLVFLYQASLPERPGELFITMAKEGSTIGGLMDAFGTAVSMSSGRKRGSQAA